MATAEIDPLHPFQIFSETVLHPEKRILQGIHILLAERMEVQPGDAVQPVPVLPEFRDGDAHPRAFRAGIVEVVLRPC